MDAQNSTHFSRYFNHAEHANMRASVSVAEQSVNFVALRRIEPGEELVFDYGVDYWRWRPAPLGDSRDYSAAAFARRDDADPTRLHNRFPLPRGTPLPLTPLTPIELQAALTLEERACRHALIRSLEYFGARRISAGDGAGAEEAAKKSAGLNGEESADEVLEVSQGGGASAARRRLRMASVSIDELADAVASCIAAAGLTGHGSAAQCACCVDVRAAAPSGAALVEWVARSQDELQLIRQWRTRVRPQASRRHDAVLVAAYLLYKNPGGHQVVGEPLTVALVNNLVAHVEKHREEADGGRAVLDCLAALEKHVARARIEQLVATMHCWLHVADGAVMD